MTVVEDLKNKAIKHHKEHGDMDGETCLLNECPIHYPKKKTVVEDLKNIFSDGFAELEDQKFSIGGLATLNYLDDDDMRILLNRMQKEVLGAVEPLEKQLAAIKQLIEDWNSRFGSVEETHIPKPEVIINTIWGLLEEKQK